MSQHLYQTADAEKEQTTKTAADGGPSTSPTDLCKGLEVLQDELPQLVVTAALKEHVQQLLEQVAHAFALTEAFVREAISCEHHDAAPGGPMCLASQQAAGLLSCTASWLTQNVGAMHDSFLEPLALVTEAALAFAHAALFSEWLLQALGSDSFKTTAESIRGAVPALCMALSQILAQSWQGLEGEAMDEEGGALQQESLLQGCQTLMSALFVGLLELGVRAQDALGCPQRPMELKGMKTLNISWKTLTEIMCRKLPEGAREHFVTDTQAREIMDKVVIILQAEAKNFLLHPKPDRINVLLFWLGHIYKLARCYNNSCSGSAFYEGLLVAALHLHEAAAAHMGSEAVEQLNAKVMPKALDVLLLLMDIQGSESVSAAGGDVWVHANCKPIKEKLALSCLEDVPGPQAEVQLALNLGMVLRCSQLSRMGIGPATLTAIAKQLVPYLLRQASWKAQEQAVTSEVEATQEQTSLGPCPAIVADVLAACVAFLVTLGDAQAQPEAFEAEAYSLAAQECTAQLYACAAGPHPYLSMLAIRVLCTACTRSSPAAATHHLVSLATLVADITATQALAACSRDATSGPAACAQPLQQQQQQQQQQQGACRSSLGASGLLGCPYSEGARAVEAMVNVLRHMARAAPPDVAHQAFTQLGRLTNSPPGAGSHPIPDLGVLASQIVLWEAFMPVTGNAAAPSSEQLLPGQQQQQQQELQERARQLFTSASQVHSLLSSPALSACSPPLRAYACACLGWLLHALHSTIKRRQSTGPCGPMLVQTCRLCADVLCKAPLQPPNQTLGPSPLCGGPPSTSNPSAESSCATCAAAPVYVLPALQLLALLGHCCPLDALQILAAGPLAATLSLPACAPYAIDLVAHTARLEPVSLPLFHAAQKAAFGSGSESDLALQHEALTMLAVALSTLRRSGSALAPQQLLPSGTTLDARWPLTSSLKAYIKDQADPDSAARVEEARASGALQAQAQAQAQLLLAPQPMLAATSCSTHGAAGGLGSGSNFDHIEGGGETMALERCIGALSAAARGLAALQPSAGPASMPLHPGGLAAALGQQCASMQKHLQALSAAAIQLAASSSAAGGAAGQCVDGSSTRLVAGAKGMAMQMDAEATGLAAGCKQLVSMLQLPAR